MAYSDVKCEIKAILSLPTTGEKWHTRFYSDGAKRQTAIERLAKKHGLGGPFGPRYNLAFLDRDGNYCGGGERVSYC